MIEQKDIPVGIIDEIRSHYSNVDFTNYNGILNESAVSRRLSYKHDINGYHKMTYIVRGDFSNDTAKIYGVYEAGIVS